MYKYTVFIDVAATIIYNVEAESPEDAYEIASKKYRKAKKVPIDNVYETNFYVEDEMGWQTEF